MKRLFLVFLALSLVGCVESKQPDSAERDDDGSSWYDITTHYKLPESMNGCKVFRLQSEHSSPYSTLYVIDCGEREIKTEWRSGKMRNNLQSI